MLESLIGSRTRRTVLEYILHCPENRFYLRGLARELGLSVSPLRRELKRLEALGLLKGFEEANVRFYVVDQSSQIFAQLKSAAGGSTPTEPMREQPTLVASTVLSHERTERIRQALRPRLRISMLAGVLASCVGLSVLVWAALYLAMTQQRLIALTDQALKTPRSNVTVVQPASKASGEMRGSRWRVVPGAFGGGFSASPEDGSY